MDVVAIASLTAAVTTLAAECGKTVVAEATKDLWLKVKALFGWSKAPDDKNLAQEVAMQLRDNEQLRRDLLELLQKQPEADGARLVGWIKAEKVVAANTIKVKGDFNM